RTWKNIIREGMRNVVRNRVMTLASIGAIMAALFVLGIIMATIINLDNIVAGLESKVEVTVYLKKGTTQGDIETVYNRINSWEGIVEVEFISKEEALENWRKEMGSKSYLLDGYNEENNPLPDTFRIKVERPEYVENIVTNARKLSAVDQVRYSADVVRAIMSIAGTTRLIGLSIVVLLSVMSVIIINNTIKLTVYSRRREINIMKYIGATDWYIRWPFLIEGMVLGLFGAVLAGGAVAGLYAILLEKANDMESILSIFGLLPMKDIMYPVLLVFALIGCLIGISASMLSIRKHLKV
ncbi:MAG TPA: permease-like cell division protein FtsX, partial [Candidatus Atribacteria bacterium]|nr:permease-like cell division protein FtsX [Candidatus Atribacteria bacterium]